MRKRTLWLAGAVILFAAIAGSVPSVATVGGANDAEPLCNQADPPPFHLESTIAFATNRDNPNAVPPGPWGEIYLVNPDGSNPRRLTRNDSLDAFANLSPDGKKIAFDSTRISGRSNVSDLFLMDADGSYQRFLTRGSSATWSPDCKKIAFHASASGTGTPLRTDPGSATTDSDLFVANVEDLLDGDLPTNLTDSADKIDDDPDWSPDGERILYTAHDVGDDPPRAPFISNTAEIYITNADGSGTPQPLTDNSYEERAPAWSPDGTRIVFSCRTGGGTTVFHICVKDVDAPPADDPQQLTSASFGDLTATWSPDGSKILFHRNRPPDQGLPQLFVMDADGTQVTQLTSEPGASQLSHWGELRVHDHH